MHISHILDIITQIINAKYFSINVNCMCEFCTSYVVCLQFPYLDKCRQKVCQIKWNENFENDATEAQI